MSRFATVGIHKDELKFSSGHFMLFSEEKRESMHGHDYQVGVEFNTHIVRNGMAFDCRSYKQKMQLLCQKLDYRFILPSLSEFLRLEETEQHWVAHIGRETISFLKRDVVILPITNVTLEELSHWFLTQLAVDPAELNQVGIHGITVTVSNGRGDSGASQWGTMSPKISLTSSTPAKEIHSA